MHVQTSNLRHNSIDLQDWSSSGDELLIISKNSHGGFHGQIITGVPYILQLETLAMCNFMVCLCFLRLCGTLLLLF